MLHTVSSDGTSIAFTREGDGPALILVHGIVSDHRVLAGLAKRLASRFTVLNVDRRGRGESGPLGDAGLDAQFDDLLAVVEAAGEPCHVFGHSLGAWVALGAAARSSALLSLTLCEPPPTTPVLNTLAGHLEAMVEGGDRESAITNLLQGLGANRRRIEQLEQTPIWPMMTALAPTIGAELRMLAAADIDLAAIEAPVLLLEGSKSPSMVAEVSDSLATTLPSGRLMTLDGHDHFAPAFAPGALEAPLVDFIREVNNR